MVASIRASTSPTPRTETPVMKIRSTACAIGIILAMLAGSTEAQQVPIPTTAAQVPGPPRGDDRGLCAIGGSHGLFMGWALVNNANRRADCSKAPEPGLSQRGVAGRALRGREADRLYQRDPARHRLREPGCRVHAAMSGRPLLRALRSSPGIALA